MFQATESDVGVHPHREGFFDTPIVVRMAEGGIAAAEQGWVDQICSICMDAFSV